ncbi:MAG TPA: hypothetical protein VOA41_06805 [Candidatus Dormibacteraeota bacterium]|nr:hypothetical protein [Candidatus Dormibacteraeota bacterium]
MSFERRDFITIGASSLFGSLFHARPGFAQASQGSASGGGQLRGGSGSLYLEGRLRAGTLKLEAQDFVEGADRAVIIHATLNSAKLYQAMFSQDHGRAVFAQVREDEHRTTLVLSDTDAPKIARLTVWHDREAPESFRIDIERFLKTRNLKDSVLDSKAAALNLLGKRKAPPFTADEIEDVFGSDPALLQFRRGRKPIRMPSTELSVGCEAVKYTPGFELLHLMWEPIIF